MDTRSPTPSLVHSQARLSLRLHIEKLGLIVAYPVVVPSGLPPSEAFLSRHRAFILPLLAQFVRQATGETNLY